MAMGTRKRERQSSFWVATADLPLTAGHPFYDRVNQILDDNGFDAFVEAACRGFYAEKFGRPSLAPAVYFRMLLIGYFEGIDSERGIAWRVSDSMALRCFLGYDLTDQTADHSTISRNRRLLDLEVHQEVFDWVLGVLADAGLLDGKTIGVDATTLEANAALRSIVRRDTGESYQAFLTRLAVASGIETPTREDLVRIDKNRKNKGSNDDWENPHDPDAKITKMKDGRTHLAHKAEHAVDMKTGAIVSVTVQPANRGDTTSLGETLEQAGDSLVEVLANAIPGANAKVPLSDTVLSEIVADKGYHSNAILLEHARPGIRTYISEPDRGQRRWTGKSAERDAVYANRRRTRGERGKRLMKKRGELIDRSFAHCYDTGGMRRTHLRDHPNILKRVLVHVAGFNLSLIMRKLMGRGTPRGLQGLHARLIARILMHWALLKRSVKRQAPIAAHASGKQSFQLAAA
ncbi:MAG TPA: transposase [Phycisphaerae bacterium]|nr:transposase [Phycisphaerae bacterium]